MVMIIGAGWGRTGTMSLRQAIGDIAGPCYHFMDLVEHKHSHIWCRAVKCKAQRASGDSPCQLPIDLQQDIQKALTGYVAILDYPACYLYKELLALYPDAVVILTLRSFDSWYASMAATTRPVTETLAGIPSWTRYCMPDMFWAKELLRIGSLEGQWQGACHDKEAMRKLWDAHIAEVKRVVPPSRLLVFQVSEGWGPLCAFLGKPVPDTPFPRLNSTDDYVPLRNYMQRYVSAVTYGGPLLVAAVLAAGVSLCMHVWARNKRS